MIYQICDCPEHTNARNGYIWTQMVMDRACFQKRIEELDVKLEKVAFFNKLSKKFMYK